MPIFSRGSELLERLSSAMARQDDQEAVVRAAVDGLVHEVGAACAGVFLSDEASATGRPAYTVNYPPDVLQMLAAVPRGAPAIANVALRTGEVQVVANIEELGPGAALTRKLGERMGVRSAAFVPLLAGGRRLGTLVFGLAEPHAFQDAEVSVLARLGDRLADALERSRLQRALARRAEHAELLASIATAAAGEEDLGRILESALDRLGRVVQFTGGSVALVEDDHLVIRAAAGPFTETALGQRLPRGRGRSWRVIDTREPYLDDDLQASGARSLSEHDGATIRSYLAVPLVWRDSAFGLLEIDSLKPGAFTDDDVRLLQAVAAVVSGSIEIARRYLAEVEALSQAEQALAVRDQFLSIASHELKTPLTPIKAASQLLMRFSRADTLDRDRLTRQLVTIQNQVERLCRLVDDLLDVTRIQAGRLELRVEPTDLGALVQQVVAEWDEEHRERVQVTVAGEVSGMWDPYRFEQVVVNLLDNALKYSPDGGAVRVSLYKEDGEAVMEVFDQGIGIPPDAIPLLFEPFARASNVSSRQFGGLGLGLFISRQVVDRHGGSIDVHSAPGEGTRFRVRLPVRGAAVAEAPGVAVR